MAVPPISLGKPGVLRFSLTQVGTLPTGEMPVLLKNDLHEVGLLAVFGARGRTSLSVSEARVGWIGHIGMIANRPAADYGGVSESWKH